MAEGNEHSGKSYGGRKSYGDRRPGNRGGKGFKPRGKGGFRRDGEGFRPRRHEDGDGFKPRRHDGDGEGYKPRREGDGEGRSGGFRKSYGKSGGFHKGGYRGNGPRRDGDGFRPRRDDGEGFKPRRREDGEGYQRRDGEGESGRSGGFHKSYGNKSYGKSGGFRKGGYRGNDRRDGEGFRPRRHEGDGDGFKPRRHEEGEGFKPRREHGENPRYQRRDDDRRNDRRDNRNDGERREFTPQEKREYREQKRSEYMRKPRRNSDGTMSFPSQNPYTDRRPDEPKMPKGMEWRMLSSDERERLRGLSKEHAENIGLHILAAYALEESDPAAALEHAKWVARQASRIDFARETLAFVAYRQGEYKLALREFRTAYRMNGFPDYLPFIADCERGVGNPDKAVELALSDEGKSLVGAAKVEMFLVYAGALGDLQLWDKAINVAHTVGRSQGLPGEYRMRAVQAEQYFLEQAGRDEEAAALDGLLDRLEDQFAEEDIDEDSDDVVIDHDLAGLTDDSEVLEKLGIDPSEAEYAPELEPESSDEDGENEAGESEDSGAEDDSDDAESDEEPAEETETAEDEPAEETVEAETESEESSETEPAEEQSDESSEESTEIAQDAEQSEETAE
ncbi:hypothetical protein [Bifidobacterium sp. SO4]|uniref:hypothetical protein n=1 Tax=Bifidobacterium sp. SO4 TaxID=2809030 RepID=UPI001BDCB89C|nr:hypothetical protein [Bifidobacterium sp. SO4]MBT1171169.1 hypothetical protein [Bifidobacterium sp. SO4]